MKYKKIVEDKKIIKDLKKSSIAEIARKVGVSKSYIYMAMKGDFAITEEFYNKLQSILRGKYYIDRLVESGHMSPRLNSRMVSRRPMSIGQVSDGYHTFNELYEHRHMLFM